MCCLPFKRYRKHVAISELCSLIQPRKNDEVKGTDSKAILKNASRRTLGSRSVYKENSTLPSEVINKLAVRPPLGKHASAAASPRRTLRSAAASWPRTATSGTEGMSDEPRTIT